MKNYTKTYLRSIILLLIILIKSITSFAQTDTTKKEKVPSWEKTINMGINLSHILNINPPTNAPKQGMSFTNTFDISLVYIKEGSRLQMANEMHSIITLNKSNINSKSTLVADNLNTLHDISYSMKKNNKWNTNIIVKAESPMLKQYDGNYLTDINNLGLIQKILNPYRLILSPGFKFQPNKTWKLSISPYSVEIFGMNNQFIVNKGIHITELDENGNFKSKLVSNLGAETNIWFDKKIRKKIDLKYRLNLSSNYFENTFKNGRIGGTFISLFKLHKNLSLTHRGLLKGDFAQKPFKPYYNQAILLNFTKAL